MSHHNNTNAYFLISVSNKENLDLCIQYALAGFTNSINGVWTFYELNEGDYISFLYGAKIYNLYRIKKKIVSNEIDPWKPVTFSMSRRTYYFPFRIQLEPIREFIEPIVRPEFAYVAENLLLRGGYRKTHFQADQTTLQLVSQMGQPYKAEIQEFRQMYNSFDVSFAFKREHEKIPEIFYFQELILQYLIRHYLSVPNNLNRIFHDIGLDNLSATDFEVLGEKALPEGHIDILIKEKYPCGSCKKIVVEVKKAKIREKDIDQVLRYMEELGDECIKGILIGEGSSRKKQLAKLLEITKDNNIEIYIYELDKDKQKYTFDELFSNLSLVKAKDWLSLNTKE